ncbi:dihydroneopterin aldolase [Parvularcula sp. LCG005]|uniref:dihydroneopterin aldolase n=1 Tax=Parvularcula sp. LCG005 TaxID=3078805 RepID=UPI002942F30A|nr:dihydroneopterin aldolase [Parvularcula sp. LCG005]WOI54714.1 dihydroneopterin aldolase [Parvularcula sp. LCG005]
MPPFYLITAGSIRLSASIGILEPERAARQPLSINVVLLIREHPEEPLSIDHVVDYRTVPREVSRLIEDQHWDLQETLCLAIAQACVDHHQDVLGAVVSTAKTAIYNEVDAVGCRMARLRPEAADFPWWTLHV